MIYETLQILKEQLDIYFEEVGLGKILILENISLWESGSKDAKNLEAKVAITLLSLEEETTLKNNLPPVIRNGKTEYKNPPVNLNLFILFSANCDGYDKSLRAISRIIQFFQGKNVFTSSNTIYNRTNVAFDILEYFKFIVKIHTPRFEELNQIWGMLGGRQLPSVIYKVQLMQIERDKKLSARPVITKVEGDLKDY